MTLTIVIDKTTCSSIYGSQIILLVVSLPLFELHLYYKIYISRFMHANWRFFASCPSKSIAEGRDRYVSQRLDRVTLWVFCPQRLGKSLTRCLNIQNNKFGKGLSKDVHNIPCINWTVQFQVFHAWAKHICFQ